MKRLSTSNIKNSSDLFYPGTRKDIELLSEGKVFENINLGGKAIKSKKNSEPKPKTGGKPTGGKKKSKKNSNVKNDIGLRSKSR